MSNANEPMSIEEAWLLAWCSLCRCAIQYGVLRGHRVAYLRCRGCKKWAQVENITSYPLKGVSLADDTSTEQPENASYNNKARRPMR
jgi:hypothetical protein